MRKLIAPIAFAAAASIATAAFAETVQIRFNDLDLATAEGKARLERRISAAEKEVCPQEASTGTRLANSDAAAECRASLRKQVMAQVDRHVAQVAARR